MFKSNFCTPNDPTGKERLAAFLRRVMVRRTHADRMFNARLLDLPTPSTNTLWLEFNDIERAVYEIVKKRCIARINSLTKDESLTAKYCGIWTLILRLRQLTSSVLLVFDSCMDLLEREDLEKLNRIAAYELDHHDAGMDTLLHLRRVLRLSKKSENIEGGISGAVFTTSETLPMGVVDVGQRAEGETGGTHGLSFHFEK